MPKDTSIEIARKHENLTMLLVGGLLVLAFGVIMVIFPSTFTPKHFMEISVNANYITEAVGLSIGVTSGIYCYIIAERMATTFPAMIISEEDIYNHTGSPSDGLINWNDIVEFRESHINGKRYLTIGVKHPQTYIERQRKSSKRQALVRLNEQYGSPIQIPAGTMDFDFEELKNLLKTRLAAFRAARSAGH